MRDRRAATIGTVTIWALLALPALLPAGAAAAPSRGGKSSSRVQISPRRMVVVAPGGARAIVTRAPFGLRFLNASGATVLREVRAAAIPAPMPIAPASQLEFGTIGTPGRTLYAPLSFLVGRQVVSQTPAGQWEGTLSSVARSGVYYSARSVRRVRRRGASAVLTVSTDDPTGRQLIVTITPGPADALRLRVRPSSSHGVAAMADSFASPRREALHGFGGRHNSLDQHGSEFYNWVAQENVDSASHRGLGETADPTRDRYLYPNGPQAAYYVQSSFISSAGYGFLLNRDQLSHWRMDSDRANAWQTEAAGHALDYVVIPARPQRAIAQVTRLTGRQPVPPTWALGSMLDRLVRFPSDPASAYEQEIDSDLRNIDHYRLHLDAYRIEGWQELPKPVLAHYIAELRARHIHPLLYFRAFVGLDTTGTDDPDEYREALAKGYVATHANGSPYTFVSNFSAPAAVIDFTDPKAVRWWRGRIWSALNLGADGFMLDFGEQVLTGMHFHNGSTGSQMHNLLPVIYGRVTREAVNAFERRHPGRHIFFFTRAGYSGTPGSAAYENANFPGDETTDWSRASGLASQTTDMLNRAIGGAYGFGTDIGGYFDVGYPRTTKELFLRWAEWAALSPVFRLHGSVLAGTHTPWSYDQQTVRVYEALTRLHRRARPLIMRLWRQADRTGMPVARPLWLAYPNDRRAAQQDQEWLLGPDVLVAPVVTQAALSRTVYFPAGCWQSPTTRTRYHGPLSQTVAAPLDQLPYFFACGSKPFSVSSRPAGRPGCPPATGRLAGSTLGPRRLGKSRAAVRRRLKPRIGPASRLRDGRIGSQPALIRCRRSAAKNVSAISLWPL